MTIEIVVQCDASGCNNTAEIENESDIAVENEGWFESPVDPFSHYCPHCWPGVKSEIEED